MEENPSLEPLISNLTTIEYLRDQLVYVKWDRQTLTLLNQAFADTLAMVRDQYGFVRIAQRVSQLWVQVGDCLDSGKLPQGLERSRLLERLDELCHILPSADVETLAQESKPDGSRVSIGEILLLGGDDIEHLLPELESAGFQIRHLTTSIETRDLLAQDLPGALVVDLDFPEGALLASFNMMAAGDERSGSKCPLFFISEQGDLAARLTAVSAGASGYFTKPVSATSLLERLKYHLRHESVRGSRVLVVDDTATEAQRIIHLLENKGIITQVLDQPREIIQALHGFDPHLLVLNLELGALDGSELARAIRQHQGYDHLPMVMVCAQANAQRHAAVLGISSDDLLTKPVSGERLLATISERLGQVQTLQYKLARARQWDTVSGLLNRHYLLEQLEGMVMGVNPRTVALMLIVLDNLREIEARALTTANDLLGQAARRLQPLLAPGQRGIRFGASVFAVLDYDAEPQALLETARIVAAALETDAYSVGHASLRLRTRIGIAIAPPGEDDYTRLIQQAELACGVARRGTGGRVRIYNPAIDRDAAADQQQQWLNEIQDAMQQQRMALVFQPIASLRGDKAARYEVFLRMHNREGWELLPQRVFASAKDSALGIALERWIIANTIRLLGKPQDHSQPLTLFVNVSLAILQDADLAEWLRAGLGKVGNLYGDLVFEIPEPACQHDPQSIENFVNVVKGLGFSVALDQFTGEAASQPLIEALAADYVKLDSRFMERLVDDPENQQTLTNLLQRLEAAKVVPIVGGIDNTPTLYTLWACGVDYVQGFALQQPQPDMAYDFSSDVL